MRASFLGDLSGQNLRDDETGVYMWPDAKGHMESYMSVTSILSVISKSMLPNWYAGMEWSRCRDLVQQVKMGELTGRDLFALFPAKGKPEGWIAAGSVYRDEKAEIGSLVHTALTNYVIARESGLDPGIDDTRPEVQSHLRQFHRWFEEVKPRYWFIEGPVFNREHVYAGTCDAIVEIDGKNYTLDYKTGSRTWAEHALQTTAYSRADFLGIKSDYQERPIPKIDGCKILLVHADRLRVYDMPCGETEWDTFKHAQALHTWKHSAQMPEEE